MNLASRYHKRIELLDPTTLVKISCSDHFIQNYETSWPTIMAKILNQFSTADILKNEMENQYRDKWSLHIQSCRTKGKLTLYAQIKKCFTLENYVLQFPPYLRRNFTKLRISAHNLAIETGRYSKPIETPIDKRVCFHCKEVENEFHFMLTCSLYDAERKCLYNDLSKMLSVPINPCEESFILIMSGLNGDIEVSKVICEFLNKCFKIRSENLSYKIETDILQRIKPSQTRLGRISKRPTILDL